ncbi:MAG: cobalamin-dependent protein [Desulfobacteraceae bacterium]|nr:cobalamin-dependent protein [Desulfobacteraceae bacterium]
MPSSGKKVMLVYADKYYLVNQVYPFGLDLIANYLSRRGHRVGIEYPFLPDMDWKKNVREAIASSEPDVVGIGIRNLDTCMSCEQYGDFKGDDYQTFYFLPQIKEIVSEIKEVIPHIPVVVGGGAFTVSPVAILEYLGLSYGIVGEGEESFCQFVEAFPDNEKISRIPNMICRHFNRYKQNLRKPYEFGPDVALERREPKFNFAYQAAGIPVQVKRGCHHRCSYCVEPLIEGRKFVFKSIDSAINELKTIANVLEDASTVFFIDTEFNIPDLRYCSDLVRAIIGEGLQERFRFVTQLIPKPFDLEFARLLADANFSVVFSCESFSNTVLEENLISYEEKDITKAIEACEKSGIDCTISLIFGLPGESHETMDHTLARMKQYPVCPTRKYEYTVGGRIYQGTPLCDYVERNSPSENLFGTKSEGYLLPYYYCAPASPFEVHQYVRAVFPNLLCYDNKYDTASHERLAIGYLSDQALWEDAIERFMGTDVAVQAGIYDYLFKQLLHVERLDDARAISLTLLDNLEQGSGAVDPGQADVVRFYLSCL